MMMMALFGFFQVQVKPELECLLATFSNTIEGE
jgi:hypothetical protein